MSSTVSTAKADAQFLRRVFLGLVLVATLSGCMAAFTTVQAMTAAKPGACLFFCK